MTSLPAPRSLAPVWARLAIGAGVGAAAAAIFDPRLRVPLHEVWRATAFAGTIGLGASIAADLDRLRPRAGRALIVAGLYAALGLCAVLLGGGSHVSVAPFFIFPAIAARVRRGSDEDPRAQYVSAQTVLMLGVFGGLALAGAAGTWLGAGARAQLALVATIAGAATTASLIRVPLPAAIRRLFEARAAREAALREADRAAMAERDKTRAIEDAAAANRRVARWCREGRHAKALALADDTIRTLERVLAPDDPALLVPLKNLAAVHAALGDHARAAAALERALPLAKDASEADELRRRLDSLAAP